MSHSKTVQTRRRKQVAKKKLLREAKQARREVRTAKAATPAA